MCENDDYCQIEIPEEIKKILKYNHGEKSMKVPFVIYVDIDWTSDNNPKKSSPTEITKHLAYGYSSFTRCSIYATKNKLDYYREINYEKKDWHYQLMRTNKSHRK